MFVGHYSPSFVVKSFEKSIPLWVLFVAAQFIDIFWAFFVLIGNEHVRIVKNFTESNHLDLYDMPYTHSLLGASLFAILAGVIYKFFAKATNRAAVLVAATVVSHWFIDLIVHKTDLSLWGGNQKFGFGLWDNVPVALTLECLILLVGIALYIRSLNSSSLLKKSMIVLFGLGLCGLQIYSLYMPIPANETQMAISALTTYIIFAFVAYLFDRQKT